MCEPISQHAAALFLVWAHPEPRKTGQTLISVNFLLVRREGGKPKDREGTKGQKEGGGGVEGGKRRMKSLLLTCSDPHTFLPASSGAPSLLATGSLRERIPAFSQRQSACEAGSEKVGGGGSHGRWTEARGLLLLARRGEWRWKKH